MKVVITGGGSFGTALANTMGKDHQILIFTRDINTVNAINSTRRNKRFYPNKTLSKRVKATNNLQHFGDAEMIFLCIPSHAISDFIKTVHIHKEALIVNGAKGFAEKGVLITKLLSTHFPNAICSIKGPSFADELIYELPTAFTIACNKIEEYQIITSVFRKDIAIFDYSDDISGIEILGILKNIYAIIVGIIDAFFNSANVRFMVLTKALNEIKKIGILMSIPINTLFSYGGIGDFALTTLNDLSRNRTLGLLIGKGFYKEEISNTIVLEGLRSVQFIVDKLNINRHSDLTLLFSLSMLLRNKIEINKFVGAIIYNNI